MQDGMSWFFNILPIILLVAIWLMLMRRGGRWMSWQKLTQRQIELLEQQVELLRATNELLRKLVVSR